MQLSAVVHCCLLWSVVTAAGPQPAYFSAYATVDESTFYIQGGSNISNSSIIYDQFYSLDLTQSWNVTNPPWSALAVGLVPARLKTVFHSISLSSNRKTLTFWDMYSLSPYSANYHLDTNAWESMERAGTYNSSVYIDTLYILDVATLTWSQGGKHQPRLGAACSVSGDYLLVWGGTSVDNTGIPALMAETPARNTRNPQDHSALTYQEYYAPDSTPNNSQWIQNKINALQAEANRLQAILHP
ncbi:hypothetical protein KI688_005731 [Linnemannia hyalina]|uniref:Uncharacterized protein n=1 Tax=Linnemannia hyalina TaxID=64524 RepID=A0A9P7Y4V3_9FUNG|nr:hypothetical protein KI688_005731 [Linnemannia hyalina]